MLHPTVYLIKFPPYRTRGRATTQEVWVFGLVDTSHTPALVQVAQRDAATLLPIIQAHVQISWPPIIVLPVFRMYSEPLNYIHRSSHWDSYPKRGNRVKTKLKRMKGCHATQQTSYLDEFMWRERYGQTKADAFANIMRDIAAQYPF